jgi:hypothetical protein
MEVISYTKVTTVNELGSLELIGELLSNGLWLVYEVITIPELEAPMVEVFYRGHDKDRAVMMFKAESKPMLNDPNTIIEHRA